MRNLNKPRTQRQNEMFNERTFKNNCYKVLMNFLFERVEGLKAKYEQEFVERNNALTATSSSVAYECFRYKGAVYPSTISMTLFTNSLSLNQTLHESFEEHLKKFESIQINKMQLEGFIVALLNQSKIFKDWVMLLPLEMGMHLRAYVNVTDPNQMLAEPTLSAQEVESFKTKYATYYDLVSSQLAINSIIA